VDWTLSEAQKAELERRLEEHDRNPGEGEPWEAAQAEILRDLTEAVNRAGLVTLSLTQAQAEELDRRLEELDRDPDGGRDWEDLREELSRRVARRRDSTA